jgi:CubicO group peptidase (beta-lactamase class C family)
MTDLRVPGAVQGWTDPRFDGVRDAFAANFDEGLEVGAAFSAYHEGRKVVDLWGGVADQDTGRPWEEDTLVLVFSSTKGATALCAHLLAERGSLDVDAPVARYWPEFAAAGKENVTVSDLLTHQAGLAWIDGTMSLEDACRWDPVVAALAAEAPHWEPRTAHGYHATTFGWLVGEVVRRIDGRSLGRFFRDEVAAPLGIDFFIGLPESEEDRVAPLVTFDLSGVTAPGEDGKPLEGFAAIAALLGPDVLITKALMAPGGAFNAPDAWNRREVRAAEIPAANGITDARSLARMYAGIIGEVDGVGVLGADQLGRAIVQQTSGPDIVLLGMDMQFGLGFMVQSSLNPVGAAYGATHGFGHFGAGGSAGWADPDAGLGFGYVMNRMDVGLAGDVRSTRLINATYEAAGRIGA